MSKCYVTILLIAYKLYPWQYTLMNQEYMKIMNLNERV